MTKHCVTDLPRLPFRGVFALLALAGVLLPEANADDKAPETEADLTLEVLQTATSLDEVIAMTEDLPDDSPLLRHRAAALQRRGVEKFFSGKIEASIADFDGYLSIFPEEDPHHWQRGISYYYAGEFEKGKAQFERHQKVNSQDVENAVFHYICAARAPGGTPAKAREDFIPITRDTRVPMKEIWALYAGEGTAEAVIAATAAGSPSEEELRNRLCYAHLYLALYHEADGDEEKSLEHIRLAAGKYRMDHYMGKVAQVHAKLRGVSTEGD